ncbi:ArsR/SmtB family transcription factor [Infirmifilum sp. NZ]|uniref:ArsR/SmtB family transcription factor n=1 Tax=Infirmifilum sp. NZ TaxID=2926850 RepID=UPI0027A18B5A|nr:helix-turn-helix domain-containing protein [Infirmifilum sp. NZ]UNQ72493.1 helix-turn-helix domain-containing protein [Infirmifilum sp. NZ]
MSSPEELLRVLKDPTRRRIVRLLAEKGPLEYSEIMRELGLTSTGRLNYHLNAMRELLEKDELGRYRLNRRGLLAYQLLREYESGKGEYTIGVHPLALLVESLPAFIVGVVILFFLLSQGFFAVNPLFLVALIAIIAVVLLRLAYGLAGKPFPYLKVRRD